MSHNNLQIISDVNVRKKMEKVVKRKITDEETEQIGERIMTEESRRRTESVVKKNKKKIWNIYCKVTDPNYLQNPQEII